MFYTVKTKDVLRSAVKCVDCCREVNKMKTSRRLLVFIIKS